MSRLLAHVRCPYRRRRALSPPAPTATRRPSDGHPPAAVRRLVAGAALAATVLGIVSGALALAGAAPAPPGRAGRAEPGSGAAGPAPPVPAAVAGPAAAIAGPLAAAFEAALAAGDADAAAALFAPDAQVKEHVAVLAAGPERVAAWVRGCLLPDVQLVPGTRRLGAAGATWAVRDALGCYWRARPDALARAWDVAPADGTLAVAVADGAIATLTIVYDPAWEQRTLRAQAAPLRTAYALATARATQTPAAAPGGAAATATRVPVAPSPQDRRTPSVGPWLAALGAALAGGGLLALLPRPREAP